MAKVVVQKYGGSSVADPERLGRVADRVARTRKAGHDVVVVVSAMGRSTDELLALARQVTETPPRRELDMLLTAGERIAMSLLSMALEKRGVDAISFTGSQSGIITNDAHAGARVVEVRPFRIQDELARGRVVIVAGYQGVSYRREVTTLGRGGSDTTAVALAAALGAEYCEICSDVDGVYSADPRVVSDPRKLAELSYEEMQVLAESGAKVLHSAAVEYARQQGLVIWARATDSDPLEQKGGTWVRVAGPPLPRRVAGITGRPVVRVAVAPGRDPTATLLKLEALWAEAGAPARWVHWSGGSCPVTALLPTEDLHGPGALEARLLEAVDPSLRFERDLAAVSCVGAGLDADPVALRALGEATVELGLKVRQLERTSLRMTAVVDAAGRDDLVRALHQKLIGAGGPGD